MRSFSGVGRRWGFLAFCRPAALVVVAICIITCVAWTPSGAATSSQTDSETGPDADRLRRIDDVVEQSIREGDLPGAVVLIWHRGQTVYQEAFGHRSVSPRSEPATTDTVYDVASLTKVIATTSAVMILVEEGRLRLRDPVYRHLAGFERHDKGDITVEHLLTHMSGLRPDFPLEEEFSGYDTAIAKAIDERPEYVPGTRFRYSDINFIVLGEIVARVSGMPFGEFVARRVLEPLGMDDTGFRPSRNVWERIAPTESCRPLGWPCGGPGASMLRGTVHDPTARRMGGVAGHAGLFSTASDLGKFGAMLVSGGTYEGVQILSPLAVARMTTPATPSAIADTRGLGWDIDSRFSANRGDLFSTGSYGHTGFTGTSIWIDPETETVVVFLSNRVHPDGDGDVTALRGRVATLAAAAIKRVRLVPNGAVDVRPGIDTLRSDGFASLAGQRVGLVTNQTGRASDGSTTIGLLSAAPNVELRRLFSPEHGIRGELDTTIPDGVDELTGVTVHSLYGDARRPTSAMLDGLDAIVIDLQDAGARFYTYAATMAYVMEEAAARGLRVVVLDRPNPINGMAVEGPLLDEEARGFTGYLSMPIRHGLTMGELAGLFNAEGNIDADLQVVPMQDWRRRLWYDETGLTWTDPSPNLRSVTQAALYPGIGAIEGANLSVGRGTDTPFEQLGAPWIDGRELAAALSARPVAGVRFYPVAFTPTSSNYAGQRCEGVRITVTNRDVLPAVRVGLEIAAALHRLYPTEFDLDGAGRLLGSDDAVARLRAGHDPSEIAADWAEGERAWRDRVAPYLLYEP